MPSIYVASLTDYNNGVLHGAWIDADQDPDAIHEEVEAMLAASPTARKYGEKAEEWAIHDYEDFDGIPVSEWDSFERVSTLAALLKDQPAAIVAHFIGDGHELDEIADLISDRLLGEYDESTELKAVAAHEYELMEGRSDIPDDIRDHLQAVAESMAESSINGGEVYTIEARGPVGSTFYVMSQC
ncbi:antirestriction protein ArdA [Streptomyces sp. NPDC029080]|uniref:antirestriction protein ArdA n=1 Tax=Streptomyces sp. NPDC029080 TaxID=3155017 RepID=UPI0033CDAE46